MGKAATPRALDENEAKAVVRNLRVSPQKLNLVAQLIRGKKVNAALADLEFSRKRIAMSSCMSFAYSPLLAYQRESQVRLMPSRRPIGLTF